MNVKSVLRCFNIKECNLNKASLPLFLVFVVLIAIELQRSAFILSFHSSNPVTIALKLSLNLLTDLPRYVCSCFICACRKIIPSKSGKIIVTEVQ